MVAHSKALRAYRHVHDNLEVFDPVPQIRYSDKQSVSCRWRCRWRRWLIMIKFLIKAHEEILEEDINFISPSYQCIERVGKEHMNQKEKNTKKNKI